jgi:catechol 2,3-dioxygenase-like lactoylglutathione lyase family enzyme
MIALTASSPRRTTFTAELTALLGRRTDTKPGRPTVGSMADETNSGIRVLQLRLVVEAEDYAEAVAFYRDVLGLREQAAFEGEGDAQVTILDAGRATLEIANPAQKRMIDEVEVGRQVAPRIRVAFEVDDAAARTREATAAGAVELAPPTRTPWRSLNARLEAPAGLQITLFQELESPTSTA